MPADDEQPGDANARFSTPPETPIERQAWLHQLREANEQLVLSSMRAQELADEAEASRAAADVSRAAAEAANRLKDEFLAVVSHELRNPLNAVLDGRGCWAGAAGSRADEGRGRHHRAQRQGPGADDR